MQGAVDAVEQTIHYDVIEVAQVALPVRGTFLSLELLQILDTEGEREYHVRSQRSSVSFSNVF